MRRSCPHLTIRAGSCSYWLGLSLRERSCSPGSRSRAYSRPCAALACLCGAATPAANDVPEVWRRLRFPPLALTRLRAAGLPGRPHGCCDCRGGSSAARAPPRLFKLLLHPPSHVCATVALPRLCCARAPLALAIEKAGTARSAARRAAWRCWVARGAREVPLHSRVSQTKNIFSAAERESSAGEKPLLVGERRV